MNNNKSAPKLSWLDLNIRRAYFGVLSAPAPHLKHTLPKTKTNQASSSTADEMNPSSKVNSGQSLLDAIVIDSSDDETVTNSVDGHTTGGNGTAQVSPSSEAQSSATNVLVPCQVKPTKEASTSSNSGANELPEWAKLLQDIPKMRTNSGAPIRNAIRKAIKCNPPAVAREKLQLSISSEIFKSNNASRTKKMALQVLRDAESVMLSKKRN